MNINNMFFSEVTCKTTEHCDRRKVETKIFRIRNDFIDSRFSLYTNTETHEHRLEFKEA